MGDTAQVGYLALAKQSAKGTAALPTAYASQQLLHDDHSIGLNRPVKSPDPEIGGGRDPRVGSAQFDGAKVTGSVNANLRFDLLPLFLLAAGFVESGTPLDVDTGKGAYRHRFIYGEASYLTMESGWGLGRLSRLFTDVLVNKVGLSASANGDTKMSFDVLGLTEAVQVTPTVTTAPANDAKGTWYGSAVTFNGLGTYRWSEASYTLENNLSDDGYVLGKPQLDDVTPGERVGTLAGVIRLGDNTPSVTNLYRAAAYGDPAALGPGLAEPYVCPGAATFGSTKKIGTSTTQLYRAVVTSPNMVLDAFPLEQSGADVLTASISARSYGSDLTIDVFNARSTAY